jgi:hypothetical protein
MRVPFHWGASCDGVAGRPLLRGSGGTSPGRGSPDDAFAQFLPAVGAAFTLVISYHNLGLPYTTINVTPTQRAVSDPPLLSPCKYDQHPSRCEVIGFRARHPGVVTITASATGEAYSEECSCWYWTGAGDIGPAVVTITGSSFYMPLLMRSQ